MRSGSKIILFLSVVGCGIFALGFSHRAMAEIFIKARPSVLSSDSRLAGATICRLGSSGDISASIFPAIPPSWLKT